MLEETDKDRNAKILGTFIKMSEKEPFLTYETEEQEDISKNELVSEKTLETTSEKPKEAYSEEDNSTIIPVLQAKDEEEKSIAEPCYVTISNSLPTNEKLIEEFSTDNEILEDASLLDAKLLMIPAIRLKAEISLSPSKFSPSLSLQLADIGFNVNVLETTLKTEQCYPLGQSILLENKSGLNKLIELPFSCFQPWSLETPNLQNSVASIPYEVGAYHEIPVSCDPTSTINSFENNCLLLSASEFGLLDSLNTLIGENHIFSNLENENDEESQSLIDQMRKSEKRVNKAQKLLDEVRDEKKVILNEAQKTVEKINLIQSKDGNKAKIQQLTSAYEKMVKQAKDLNSKIKEIVGILDTNQSEYDKHSNDLIVISEKKGILPSSKELATAILDEVPSLTKEELQFKLQSNQFFIFSWFITVNTKQENEEKLIHAVIFSVNNSTKIVKVNVVQS